MTIRPWSRVVSGVIDIAGLGYKIVHVCLPISISILPNTQYTALNLLQLELLYISSTLFITVVPVADFSCTKTNVR